MAGAGLFQMSPYQWTPTAQLSMQGLQLAGDMAKAHDKKINQTQTQTTKSGSSGLGSTLGSIAGTALGAFVGGPAGAAIGGSLGGGLGGAIDGGSAGAAAGLAGGMSFGQQFGTSGAGNALAGWGQSLGLKASGRAGTQGSSSNNSGYNTQGIELKEQSNWKGISGLLGGLFGG